MDAGLIIWTAASASIGSLVTGYTLKRIEHNREARDAGRLEVDKKRHIDRYEAVREILGLGRNLYHYVSRATGVIIPEEVRGTAPRMREAARSNVAVVGEEYVIAVTDFTDRALEMADEAESYVIRHHGVRRTPWTAGVYSLRCRSRTHGIDCST